MYVWGQVQFTSVGEMQVGKITWKSTISWESVREAAAKGSAALQFPNLLESDY